MNRKLIRFICCYLFSITIAIVNLNMAACSSKVTSSSTSTTSGVTLSSIVISPGTPDDLTVGSKQQFVATATWSDGSKTAATIVANWISSNPAVATINSYGSAIGIVPGNTTITAILYGVSSSPVNLTVIIATSTTSAP